MAKKKDEIGGDEKGEVTTPEVEPETTPEPEPEPEEPITLTPKEHQELTKQAKAATELGRSLKTTLEANTVLQRNFDAQSKQINTLGETLKSLKDKERERELKSVEGQPDLVDAVRIKHQAEDEREAAARERSELDADKAQHQAAIDKALKTEAENKASELAKTSGLTADLILQIGSDTAEDGRVTYNLKRMEDIAKTVPKSEEEEGEEEEIKGQTTRAPGLGSRSATRGLNTMEDYDKAYNEGRITTEEYAKARERFGVAY